MAVGAPGVEQAPALETAAPVAGPALEAVGEVAPEVVGGAALEALACKQFRRRVSSRRAQPLPRRTCPSRT